MTNAVEILTPVFGPFAIGARTHGEGCEGDCENKGIKTVAVEAEA